MVVATVFILIYDTLLITEINMTCLINYHRWWITPQYKY